MTRRQEIALHVFAEPLAEANARAALNSRSEDGLYDGAVFERYWLAYTQALELAFSEQRPAPLLIH